MKDRWKMLITSLVFTSILALIFLFLGVSMRMVPLRDYGVLLYTYFQTVDPTQQVRINGNYLVGLDHAFLSYPRGIIKHSFVAEVLSNDKAIFSIEGLFLGRLIPSQIIKLHFEYGPNQYLEFVRISAEELFRESLEAFQLQQIISNRAAVDKYVSSYVCIQLQAEYEWIRCDVVSTGQIVNLNADSTILTGDTSIQSYYSQLLEEVITAQKMKNVYDTGGAELINSLETLSASLFLNTTILITETLNGFNKNAPEDVFAAAAFAISDSELPVLSNQVEIRLYEIQ